jgi:hypothetical protein
MNIRASSYAASMKQHAEYQRLGVLAEQQWAMTRIMSFQLPFPFLKTNILGHSKHLMPQNRKLKFWIAEVRIRIQFW